MSEEPAKGTDIPLNHCGAFDEDAVFASVKDKYRQEQTEPQGVNPELQAAISDPNVLKLTSDADGVYFSNDKFELVVDVRGYKPENVKCIVTGNVIEVNASQTIQEANGSKSYEKSMSMNRAYQLPSQINPQTSVCNLSSDGFLYVMAAWNK
ncbi:heat shock protein hsp-12.2-related [Holotrichia oblita]|uniref:Heat shock protein hsp-12.2-related n=1 Tax=Holotrichia oblita TaxID=644536 RepID=A0ACB9SYX5_HOLOL|nr:heat shock protein hsp-12.2-related [Holotrichia oblita]